MQLQEPARKILCPETLCPENRFVSCPCHRWKSSARSRTATRSARHGLLRWAVGPLFPKVLSSGTQSLGGFAGIQVVGRSWCGWLHRMQLPEHCVSTCLPSCKPQCPWRKTRLEMLFHCRCRYNYSFRLLYSHGSKHKRRSAPQREILLRLQQRFGLLAHSTRIALQFTVFQLGLAFPTGLAGPVWSIPEALWCGKTTAHFSIWGPDLGAFVSACTVSTAVSSKL